jgi:hypothetical protein
LGQLKNTAHSILRTMEQPVQARLAQLFDHPS